MDVVKEDNELLLGTFEEVGDGNRDRELRAEVILEAVSTCPRVFTKNGLVHPVKVAMQSTELVTNLIKLGLFSINVPNMSEMQEAADGEGISFDRVPSFILGMAVHYAVEAAPIAAEPSPDGTPMVSLDDLASHVERIEEVFGTVSVDHDLVNGVARLAARRLVAMEPAMAGYR